MIGIEEKKTLFEYCEEFQQKRRMIGTCKGNIGLVAGILLLSLPSDSVAAPTTQLDRE